MGAAGLGPHLPNRAAVTGSVGSPRLYFDSLVPVPVGRKKELVKHVFPEGVYRWISLGKLSVVLQVDPVTSCIYVGLAIEFIRTGTMCMSCAAHITLHNPRQEREDQKRFRCPPHLKCEADLAKLREQMAQWLQKRVGEGYFLRVRMDSSWDMMNTYRQARYEVLVLAVEEGMYSIFAQFLGLAKSRLQLQTPSWYTPVYHLRIDKLDCIGRTPSGDAMDGYWRTGQGSPSNGVATHGRSSSCWSCP